MAATSHKAATGVVLSHRSWRGPPRSYVDRLYNVQRWTTMPRGGHFGGMGEPGLFLDDLRAFVRELDG